MRTEPDMETTEVIEPMPTNGVKSGPLPWLQSPLSTGAPQIPVITVREGDDSLKHAIDRRLSTTNTTPSYERRHESSTIELFYDLFFVASLATFTTSHPNQNAESIRDNVLFFLIVWNTWLQTTVYDVRFATDSVFHRVCKGLSFGVFVGFVVASTLFNTSHTGEDHRSFRILCIVLMASRLALAMQYTHVLVYSWRYSQARAPLIVIIIGLLATATTYGGSLAAFPDVTEDGVHDRAEHPITYIVFYAGAFVETIVSFAVASIWPFMSFQGTHLVERLGLLTLIILGEGIIDFCQSFSRIISRNSLLSSETIGLVSCAILLIYLIWILYFDQIEVHVLGRIRQQVWTILHFPLHLAILLTVQGSADFMLWTTVRPIIVRWEALMSKFDSTDDDPFLSFDAFASAEDVEQYLAQSLAVISTFFRGTQFREGYDSASTLARVSDLDAPYNTTAWKANATELILSMFTDVQQFIFTEYALGELDTTTTSNASEPPSVEDQVANMLDWDEWIQNIFTTTMIYFPVAAGSFLICLSVLLVTAPRNKDWSNWISIASRVSGGTALCLIPLASTDALGRKSAGFVSSLWPVTTVMLVFLTVIILDFALAWIRHLVKQKRGSDGATGTA
jgi:low temperature requirement protein LtrA